MKVPPASTLIAVPSEATDVPMSHLRGSPGVTCLRYYNEVPDDAACPCGCRIGRQELSAPAA